jgi:hypothetical protein
MDKGKNFLLTADDNEILWWVKGRIGNMDPHQISEEQFLAHIELLTKYGIVRTKINKDDVMGSTIEITDKAIELEESGELVDYLEDMVGLALQKEEEQKDDV